MIAEASAFEGENRSEAVFSHNRCAARQGELSEGKSIKGGFAAGKAAKGGGKHAERAARMGKISDRKFSKLFALLFVLYKK